MEKKNFIKTEEDFTCENCGYRVKGTGYTNHCPQCLYSKHVDNVPGDRSNPCGGLMAPVGVELKGGEYDIIHKCLKCHAVKRNQSTPEDDFDKIIKLSTNFLV
ncbi:MAG: RNHCP domain-containing protein [Patescibacteria group bacterium]